MGKMLRNIVRGVGTLLEIHPPPRQSRVMKNLSRKTDADLLREDWEQVGRDLSYAMNQFQTEGSSSEQKTQAETSKE